MKECIYCEIELHNDLDCCYDCHVKHCLDMEFS